MLGLAGGVRMVCYCTGLTFVVFRTRLLRSGGRMQARRRRVIGSEEWREHLGEKGGTKWQEMRLDCLPLACPLVEGLTPYRLARHGYSESLW